MGSTVIYDITIPLDTGALKAAPLYQEFHSVKRSDTHTFFLPITLLTIADAFLYRTQQQHQHFLPLASLIKCESSFPHSVARW